jgi:hypothetical protein
MGADLRPLGGVERPFEERAEDGGLDAAPVLVGGDAEQADFVVLQG